MELSKLEITRIGTRQTTNEMVKKKVNIIDGPPQIVA